MQQGRRTDADPLAILAIRLVAERDVAQAATKLGVELVLTDLAPLKTLERTIVTHRLYARVSAWLPDGRKPGHVGQLDKKRGRTVMAALIQCFGRP